MIQLPVELQRGCIDVLSDDLATLKALRLVNKGFHELASESLFRTVSFTNVGNSPERFLNIIHSSLRKHVRHAIINTSEHPDREQNEDEEEDDDDDDNGKYLADGPDILCTFADAIAQLPQLESLKRIELKFSSVCTVEDYTHTRYRDTMLQIREDENFRAKIQDLCFQALAQSESFESLTIQNLQDAMPQDVMESKSFLAVRERLTELRLRILRYHAEPEGGQSAYADAQHNGLRRFLPKYWLKPTTNQLTRRYNMRSDHPMTAYYSLDCRKPPGFEPIGWDVYEPELEEEAQRRQETDLQEEDRRALTALMETVEQRIVEAI
ncbi:hypothetical protein J4E89_002095 [Alternaria sp. Ai002NY15]|nr:hypothetical protein J4E89_002095 [Alternaria sp. Ai002NY15]